MYTSSFEQDCGTPCKPPMPITYHKELVDIAIKSESEFNMKLYQLSKAGIDIRHAPSWYDYHKEHGDVELSWEDVSDTYTFNDKTNEWELL